MTADLRAIAAGSLRRLAVETRAAAAVGRGGGYVTAAPNDHDRAQALLAETRREAVADLERLRDSLPLASRGRHEAAEQARLLYHGHTPADVCDRWATAWEALP